MAGTRPTARRRRLHARCVRSPKLIAAFWFGLMLKADCKSALRYCRWRSIAAERYLAANRSVQQ